MRAPLEALAWLFDKEISGFSIDSRATAAGELFFALSPEDYRRHCFTATSFADAHRFIPEAFEQGALAVVARAARVEGDEELRAFHDRLLLVEDVIEALQLVARGTIDAWGRPVIAITGSAGKTTTKDLTAHVLGSTGRRVLRSRKNYNNELGVALSVLQMESDGARPTDFDVAVLEMGMSMPGEIARHCLVAPPDIAVLTNVAPVHLEFMGSVEAIAAGKAQLVEGLKRGGTAILNADDERVAAMRAKAGHASRVITYGTREGSDVLAFDVVTVGVGTSRFNLRTPEGEEAEVLLPMHGRHNVLNALAAAAVATCFGIGVDEIASALATAAPSEMRGEVLRFNAGFTVVDDSYNSNPQSLLSMSEALAGGGEGVERRIVVAGEMLELGDEGEALHREAGREIAGFGVDVLWGVRGLARALVEGARRGGMGAEATRFFETSEEAASALPEFVRAGDLVLVKGSRGVHTERVVEALKARYGMSDE
ncbi:MAG: UDP-N-acetylmuramoyl-tripeptide--D-alanyl-D-alanine ligase [Acidobacteriota bacterium]|jgi:UDP-N-acetylmuramoyl-tripeptide--D-alanyl-D-alanine ligase|nr:UDP-N-acetylmuramoyl-tripeptide--D-alanyl-D-alanine ligase [Acidobacteriota bacterium]